MDITDYQKWVSEFYKKETGINTILLLEVTFFQKKSANWLKPFANMKLDVTDLTKPNKLIWKT